MATSVAIKAEGLYKSYGSKEAVRGVDLSVESGTLYGFLGPNGAGKSTTIKMLVGLLRPTGGTVEVAGIDVAREPLEAKRRLALVPDKPNLPPKLSGKEFLQFAGEVYHVPGEEIRRRGEELFGMFGLSEAADELIGGYSHGMQQKCALAAALLHEPEVLLLDEPTVGLDPASARQVKDLLRRLVERGGAVFMATHVLEIAESLCDRVGIIQNGKMLAEGTVPELRQRVRASEGSTLEDVFLGLTGTGEDRETASYLRGEDT